MKHSVTPDRRAFGWTAAITLLAWAAVAAPATAQISLPKPDVPPAVVPAPEPPAAPAVEAPAPAPTPPAAVVPAPAPARAAPTPAPSVAPAPDASPPPDAAARRAAARRAAERVRAARVRQAERRERRTVALAASREAVGRSLSGVSVTFELAAPAAGRSSPATEGPVSRSAVLLVLLGLSGLSAMLALSSLAWTTRHGSRAPLGGAPRFLEQHRIEFAGVSTACLVVALLALTGLV